ncbi:low molecular weight protein arginine phosphatase [Sulfobacillus harzensis]|uniref:Low molecular weight protein arginine phosphatase n=1 Tax=Sulfobacillus harzensis TaxID=2729629 RepID=A0A7Y0L0D8_9FIRM|nr:low molecular weight protein arginine phosphatase [Sulfobacillus harzensis]NMP21014.1 low molecular weight protein arginine phosphatase [Sulfobacillus harzensis]
MSKEVPEILFVCTGNTCRSPMAEALWKAMGGRGASAGVSAWSGQPAAEFAQLVVTRYGGRLDSHRARDLDEIRDDPDFVLTMTESQRLQVMERRPDWNDRTFCLGDFAGEPGDIQDPAGHDRETYQAVADRLHALLARLKERLDTKLE